MLLNGNSNNRETGGLMDGCLIVEGFAGMFPRVPSHHCRPMQANTLQGSCEPGSPCHCHQQEICSTLALKAITCFTGHGAQQARADYDEQT